MLQSTNVCIYIYWHLKYKPTYIYKSQPYITLNETDHSVKKKRDKNHGIYGARDRKMVMRMPHVLWAPKFQSPPVLFAVKRGRKLKDHSK